MTPQHLSVRGNNHTGFDRVLSLQMALNTLNAHLRSEKVVPGTQCVRNVHISIAQHVALFIDWESQAILI